MFGFRIKHRNERSIHDTERVVSSEVLANKQIKAHAVREAKAANMQFKQTLARNGFTLKLYVAAGGHNPQHT